MRKVIPVLAIMISLFAMSFAQLANSAWPMFGQNNQHSFRSAYNGPSTPKLLWVYDMVLGAYPSPVLATDGTIYSGSMNFKFFALKPDGTKKWEYTSTQRVQGSAAVAKDGTVYQGVDDGNLNAYNPDGTVKWIFKSGTTINGTIDSKPAIANDGTIYVGSNDKNVYAINPDGTRKWAFLTGGLVNSGPAIATDGTVYIGSYDKNLYALNPDGTKKWSFTTGDMVQASPSIALDGTIYIGSNDSKLYALKPDGTLKWSYTTGGAVAGSAGIAADGTIYFGSDDNKVYALNPDGTLKWSYTTKDGVHSSPAIGADGVIYIPSTDANIYAINPDGTKKWSYQVGFSIQSSPSISATGVLYVGCQDGKFYAIGNGTTTTTSTITVTSPIGGEVWKANTNNNITWTSTGNISNVKLDLYKGGTLYYNINPSVKNNGRMGWMFTPKSTVSGTDYRVKISDVADTTVSGQSPADFEIISGGTTTPTISITSPNGGEQWQQNTPHQITWTSTGITGNVIIELFKGGVFDKNITATAQNTGSFAWTVPQTQTAGTDYKIKITSAADVTITSQSAANFAVTAGNTVTPTITITSPNGGEQWQQGTPHPITWTSTGNISNVKIELLKGGVYIYTISANVPNSGSFVWTVLPNQTAGIDYKIKISDVADPTVTSQSAADFEVTAGNTVTPTITITSPNGGEKCQQDSNQTITWTSTGNPGNLRIELFKAGVFLWVIRDIAPDTGTWRTIFPAAVTPVGTDYRVKISVIADPTITTTSAADFEVIAGNAATPTITVISPNGGEKWQQGKSQNILWTSANVTGNVKIDLYKKGVFSSTIAASLPNTGNCTATISAAITPVGTDYRIKISSVIDPAINNMSAADFEITAAGTITKAQWPMYHHAIQHTGRSPYNGPANPAQQWTLVTGSSIHSSPAIAADGTIYIGSWDKNLYAMNPDGTKKWSFATNDRIWSSPGIGDDGTIYIGSDDKVFYAINPDGTQKWKYDTGSRVAGSPTFAPDGTIYVGTDGANLHAFNPDGRLLWTFGTTDAIYSTPAIGADGTIYVGCYNNTFYALTTAGLLKWKFSASSYFSSSPAIATDGTIYVGCHNGKVYALNPDGTQKWAFAAGTGGEVYCSPAIGADGTIYAGSTNNNFYAINPDGTQKWVFAAADIVYTSPCIDASGVIYIGAGTKDRKLYAINPDGTQKWSFTTGGQVYSSASIGANGVLYFGSYDNKFYALGTGGAVQPGITITSPNGGEQWSRGSSQNITWTSTGITSNVKIDLFKGGALDSIIAASVVNNGTYNWTIPATQTIGTDYKVKISSVVDTTITSQSAANFAVTAGNTVTPTITVTSPNGGEQWLKGSVHPITWTSTGNPGNVKIELFKAGVLNIVITADVTNNGTYNWTVPATQAIGTDYRVKISEVADATVTGQSAADFSITGGTTTTSPWPMFRHDLLHTGRSPYNGPATAAVKWSFDTGAVAYSSPAIGADGTVYAGSNNGNVYAINPDGTKKWAFKTGDFIHAGLTIAPDGTVYAGSHDGNMYAINPDGTKKWSFATGSLVRSNATIGLDGTIYFGSQDNKVYALNPNGTLKWSFTTGGFVDSTPAIGTDGTIYVGSFDQKLYAFNPSGTVKWSFVSGGGIYSSPAIASDGTIYFGTQTSQVYAITSAGTLKWKFNAGGGVYSSPAIGADGTVYFGSNDSHLYALAPATGTKKWDFFAGSWIYSSPAIGADGTVYVGSDDKKLYAINPDGTQKWAFTAGAVIGSSPAIGSDGTIYFSSSDHKIYAIATGGTVQPGITITSPNGGEQWSRGSSQNITWTSTGITGNVKIDLFKGGIYVNTISWATPNSGSFNWTVAMVNAPGTDYKVKITSLANTAITSQSAADFAITSTTTTPTITVISPNGGEQWQQGTTHNIIWRSTGVTGNVMIELYKTGALDSVISATVANTGSYSWTIPGTQVAGTDYRVRISSVATSTVASQSAGNFAITATAPVASIAVTSPNGGEKWVQGSAQNITWTSNSITGNVKIDLYKAGTISSNITASVANSGTYNWTVPATQTAGTDYRVRITAVANTRVFDDSDADFSVTATVKTPGVPVQVSPANNAANVKSPVTIAWLPVSGAVSYEYELYSAASATVPVETNVVTTTSAVIQLALTDGTKYSWRVRATNASDISSAYSSLWAFTTTISVAPLNAPTLITPADGAIDVPLSTLFTWSPVTNAIAYDIDISTNADFSKKATLSTTKTSITATLANVTIYYWRVRAKQGNNVSPWSTVNTFTTIAFVPTSGLDAAISNSKVGSQLMGVGVINDTGDFQTVQLDMPINRQNEYYIVVKNTGNQPDSFLISSTSTIGSKWKVNVFDISGINRTVKVFNSGWTSYAVKPGESVQLMLRFAAVSGQVIDATNPPTQSITIKAQSLKDLYSGSTTPASDTVIATAVLVKRFGL